VELPKLKIGNKFAKYPIIQGGMAVRVSLHNLAGNVAKNGAVGIVALSGMTDPQEAIDEIRKAKEIAGPEGIVGANIMGVVGQFKQLLAAAIKAGADLIIQGAGFREDIFAEGKKHNVPIFAIASSVKVAQKAEALGASAVVVEGCDAGGHLGFPPPHPFRKTIDILREVIASVKIPVIAAGGIFTGSDIAQMIKEGAAGVQMATRFVATNECDAGEEFKQAFVNAKEEDIVIIKSPVGLPGRAINTPLVDKMKNDTAPKSSPSECVGCIGPVCDKSYCILKVLENARKGDLDNGLVFCGSNVFRIKKIIPVKDLIEELVNEARQQLLQIQ